MVLLQHRTRGATNPTPKTTSQNIPTSNPIEITNSLPESSNPPLLAAPTTTRTDLSSSIGTLLSGIQLSALEPSQLSELSNLVSERGVVFLRDQELPYETQLRISRHFGPIGTDSGPETENGDNEAQGNDEEEEEEEEEGEGNQWYNDKLPPPTNPSYTIFHTPTTPTLTPAESSFLSKFGLYDTLSAPMQTFLSNLYTTNKSKQQNPAIQTHPTTNLKALNIDPSTTKVPDLNKMEADTLLRFLDYHMQASDEHKVRWRWSAGDVAVWDNRSVALKRISAGRGGRSRSSGWGVKIVCVGEQAYFDGKSESRRERGERVDREKKERVEEVRRVRERFNNTPLRRILARQLGAECVGVDSLQGRDFGTVPVETETAIEIEAEARIEVGTVKEPSRADSVVSDGEPGLQHTVTHRGNAEQRTERWTEEVHAELVVSSSTPAPVPVLVKKRNTSNNTPLRRIIERQVSAGLKRSVEWK